MNLNDVLAAATKGRHVMQVQLRRTITGAVDVRVMGAPRKKPREGDRRETKKHGVQYRIQEIAHNPCTGKPIGYRVSNGRPVYEWRAAADLIGTRYERLLTPEDRAALSK